MANSTLGMDRSTWLMTGLTGGGVLLLWFTLQATRRTLKEAENTTAAAVAATAAAQDGADAGWAAADATQNIGEVQIRAYVGLNVLYESKMQDTGIVRPSMKITNFGQSPALNATIWCKIVDTAPDEFTYDGGKFLAKNITIRPAQDVPFHWADRIEDRNHRFLYGYIEYSDIHKRRWCARFAKKHMGGDWYTYHDQHNDEISVPNPYKED